MCTVGVLGAVPTALAGRWSKFDDATVTSIDYAELTSRFSASSSVS